MRRAPPAQPISALRAHTILNYANKLRAHSYVHQALRSLLCSAASPCCLERFGPRRLRDCLRHSLAFWLPLSPKIFKILRLIWRSAFSPLSEFPLVHYLLHAYVLLYIFVFIFRRKINVGRDNKRIENCQEILNTAVIYLSLSLDIKK